MKKTVSIWSCLKIKLFMLAPPTIHSMWRSWWFAWLALSSRLFLLKYWQRCQWNDFSLVLKWHPGPKGLRAHLAWGEIPKQKKFLEFINFSISLPDKFLKISSPPGQCIQRCFLPGRMYGCLCSLSASTYLQKTSRACLDTVSGRALPFLHISVVSDANE